MSVDEDNFIRGLRFEAAWKYAETLGRESSELSRHEAIGLITWNVADAFMLNQNVSVTENSMGRVKIGKRASFIVLNGDPLSLKSKIQVFVDGKKSLCRPTQI